MLKTWSSPIFEKNFFPAENAGNMPENHLFGISSRFSHYFFLTFCSKMRFSNAQNMVESDLREKNFSGRKCWKYAGNRRFCRFSLDFFHIFRCFFSHKNIIDIAFSFVRFLLCSFVRLLVRALVRTFILFTFYIYHKVGPMCIVLVF